MNWNDIKVFSLSLMGITQNIELAKPILNICISLLTVIYLMMRIWKMKNNSKDES